MKLTSAAVASFTLNPPPPPTFVSTALSALSGTTSGYPESPSLSVNQLSQSPALVQLLQCRTRTFGSNYWKALFGEQRQRFGKSCQENLKFNVFKVVFGLVLPPGMKPQIRKVSFAMHQAPKGSLEILQKLSLSVQASALYTYSTKNLQVEIF